MSDDHRLKMRATLNECLLHAEILQQDLDELGDTTFSADTLESSLAPATVRLLDQLAYRFAKLQDSLGEKMLPLLLLVAEEPMALTTTFAEKLQRLERLGRENFSGPRCFARLFFLSIGIISTHDNARA